MEAEPQTVAKPRGISNGLKAFLVIVIGTGLVLFIAWLVFYLMSRKSRDDAKNPPAGVIPVEIDLTKYLGKWYEIARLPNEFEDFKDSACSMVTAEYGAIVGDADTISVKNTCQVRSGSSSMMTLTSGTTTSNGGLVTTTTTTSSQDVNITAGTKISNGHAEVNSNGTLAVTFVPDPLPKFYGSYTCIYRQLGTNADIDPWQTSVVVGGKDKINYAWILSRTPIMLEQDKVLALAALTANGVDVSKMIMTVQTA
jgi:apolipoprotein D and lipocalin family protein